MNIGYLVFLEYTENYQKNIGRILNNFNKINKNNKTLFIITKNNKNVNYLNHENIHHIFFNTGTYFLKYLSKILYLKKINKSYYNKIRRFIIIYLAILLISEKKFNYLIFSNNIKFLDHTFDKQINFGDDCLFNFIDRSVINYLDDVDFFTLNFNNKHFSSLKKYILNEINSNIYEDNFEPSLEYMFTKIRFYSKNILKANNINLANSLNAINIKNLGLNIFGATKLSQYMQKEDNYIKKYNSIRQYKFKQYLKRKINLDYVFSNLELTGLIEKFQNILNVSNFNNSLNITFDRKLHQIQNINTLELLNFNLRDIKIIFFEFSMFTHENFIEILEKIKKAKVKTIIRKRYFLKKKDQYKDIDFDKIENFLKNNFNNINIIKNLKSDIIILND